MTRARRVLSRPELKARFRAESRKCFSTLACQRNVPSFSLFPFTLCKKKKKKNPHRDLEPLIVTHVHPSYFFFLSVLPLFLFRPPLSSPAPTTPNNHTLVTSRMLKFHTCEKSFITLFAKTCEDLYAKISVRGKSLVNLGVR